MDEIQNALDYVKIVLLQNNGENSIERNQFFRSRYQHTLRVIGWVKKLLKDKRKVDEEVLLLATAFHDIGYSDFDNANHPQRGKVIFCDYARNQKWNNELIDKVAFLIENHTNMPLFYSGKSMELITLVEADLLDEEGALSIVWDCMEQGATPNTGYVEALEAMKKYSLKESNPLITELARKEWENKQEFVKKFISELERDLFI